MQGFTLIKGLGKGGKGFRGLANEDIFYLAFNLAFNLAIEVSIQINLV